MIVLIVLVLLGVVWCSVGGGLGGGWVPPVPACPTPAVPWWVACLVYVGSLLWVDGLRFTVVAYVVLGLGSCLLSCVALGVPYPAGATVEPAGVSTWLVLVASAHACLLAARCYTSWA